MSSADPSALGMEPIPHEGGWFRVTWRSREAGAIVAFFTNEPWGFSAMHRLAVTEVWFAHAGAPFELLLLKPGGESETVTLGADLTTMQVVVPPGVWMGGRPLGDWSLVSTVTVPPFTDDAFTLGSRSLLCSGWPSRTASIERLTRDIPN